VADFTGAVVLTGIASSAASGLTRVELDGHSGVVHSTDAASGPVAVGVHPWDIALTPADVEPDGSAQNRLHAEVVSVTTVGSRTRVGLTVGQPVVAEVTTASAERLALRPGSTVGAVWKATATRLIPR
jgi:molybdate transport system ATP-binding protein